MLQNVIIIGVSYYFFVYLGRTLLTDRFHVKFVGYNIKVSHSRHVYNCLLKTIFHAQFKVSKVPLVTPSIFNQNDTAYLLMQSYDESQINRLFYIGVKLKPKKCFRTSAVFIFHILRKVTH